jgi:hypothetical protein
MEDLRISAGSGLNATKLAWHLSRQLVIARQFDGDIDAIPHVY